MECYVCAKLGKKTEAVGVCIVCGMGVCMEHAVRDDVEMWTGGYPFPSATTRSTIPRILCEECHVALH